VERLADTLLAPMRVASAAIEVATAAIGEVMADTEAVTDITATMAAMAGVAVMAGVVGVGAV
jgi:hypothetical protein